MPKSTDFISLVNPNAATNPIAVPAKPTGARACVEPSALR